MKKLYWIFWTAFRHLLPRRREKGQAAFLFSVAGIALGVMTLVTVISVMNGFQQGFIGNLNEISSFHVRISPPAGETVLPDGVLPPKDTVAVVRFADARTIIQAEFASPRGAQIRAVETDIFARDAGLMERLTLVSGDWDLSGTGGILLATEQARHLRVLPGDTVSVMALVRDPSGRLSPRSVDFNVRGIFKSGYYEIDDSLGYISLTDGETLLGLTEPLWGIKIRNLTGDARYGRQVSRKLPDGWSVTSWRDYNRSFFSALLAEKIMMIAVVGLVFVVVAVNLFQSLKRSVIERMEELAILKAMGGAPAGIRSIYLIQGLVISAAGGLAGTLSGILVAGNINRIFGAVETVVNGLLKILSVLIPGMSADFSIYSSAYFYLTEVPVKIMGGDLAAIFILPVAFSVLAALLASGRVSSIRPAEVLRYE
jgi:lipoprotein-releasing system permease protein